MLSHNTRTRVRGLWGVNGAGGESQAIYDTFNDALGVLGLGGNQGDDTPAAYLNYIFFDESNGFDTLYQHDDYGWKPVPSSAYFNKTLVQFNSAITIEKPGYIYVYLSYENESNNWVYFDDLKVTYTKSQVVQSNNYYAFGLQTKDSWTRMDTKPNQYLYNAGSELNEATSNYEMMYRNYDPAIGRMSGVDPMVNSFASLTPYNYSFNDPVYWNDPSGAVPEKVTENGGNYEDCSCGMYGANYNLATYGGGFGRYGVATGWSDGYVDMILDAKQGDAQALETYGAMHGVSPIGDVNIMSSLKQAGLLDFNSSGDAGFWSYNTSSPLTITATFNKFLRGQTQGDRINLGNSDHKELFNQIMQGLYEGHRDGRSMFDVFDFSNAEKNFSKGWGGVYSAEFQIDGVAIKFSLVAPIGSKDPLPIVLKRPENIYGIPNPSSYPTNSGDGTKTFFPFVYKFYDYDKGTVAQFNYHRDNAQAYSNFISYMNTGKPTYLFK